MSEAEKAKVRPDFVQIPLDLALNIVTFLGRWRERKFEDVRAVFRGEWRSGSFMDYLILRMESKNMLVHLIKSYPWIAGGSSSEDDETKEAASAQKPDLKRPKSEEEKKKDFFDPSRFEG